MTVQMSALRSRHHKTAAASHYIRPCALASFTMSRMTLRSPSWASMTKCSTAFTLRRFFKSALPPSANAGLNLSGTLSYSALNNTFTGPVTSTSGLAGNATCRFYGPGIGAATGVKVLGSPTEIGCTFAANNTTTGVMQGALGAN